MSVSWLHAMGFVLLVLGLWIGLVALAIAVFSIVSALANLHASSPASVRIKAPALVAAMRTSVAGEPLWSPLQPPPNNKQRSRQSA